MSETDVKAVTSHVSAVMSPSLSWLKQAENMKVCSAARRLKLEQILLENQEWDQPGVDLTTPL